MRKGFWKFYFIALGILLLLSAYPVAMGLKIVVLQLQNGSIQPQDYAKYVIPYTAICISILTTSALYPIVSKLRKHAVLAATVLALALFTGVELYMESISINPPATQSVFGPVQTTGTNAGVRPNTAVDWQLTICAYTPSVLKAYLANPAAETPGAGAILRQDYSDAFKIHYFLVAFVIIALVTGVFYGYGNVYAQADKRGRSPSPLNLQLASAVLLLAFCVFANFTGFFRAREDVLPPLSAVLTGAFFVVLGTAAGIYLGSRLLGRRKAISIALPAAAAILVCALMYFGEYQLMLGSLYRFGTSSLFRGLPGIVLAPVDLLVILLAGGVTAGVLAIVGKVNQKEVARLQAALPLVK